MKYLRALRVKQWSKNALVLVAPVAAGHVFVAITLEKITLAFLAFCAISSASYLINDLRDVEIDRKNPAKSNRPIASGALSLSSAYLLIGVMLAICIAASLFLPIAFGLTIATYFVITLAYSLGLKREPVLELIIVSSGFALRAIAGATATHTPSSKWFLMVSVFAPLVVVTSKRISELKNVASENQRPVLHQYTPQFLNFLLSVAAAVTLTSYSLWAFSLVEAHPYAQISLIFICIQLFRYVWLAESGRGEVPEDLIFKDPISVASMLTTAALLLLSVYAKG